MNQQQPEEQIHARNLLQELLDLEEGLTDWEVNFVESLSHQAAGSFSRKQIETLTKIHSQRIG